MPEILRMMLNERLISCVSDANRQVGVSYYSVYKSVLLPITDSAVNILVKVRDGCVVNQRRLIALVIISPTLVPTNVSAKHMYTVLRKKRPRSPISPVNLFRS